MVNLSSRNIADSISRDLRQCWRALRSRPALSLLAVLTLSVGIGANGAVFSVFSAVLLRPLPYAEPGRLLVLWETGPGPDTDLRMTSLSNFTDYGSRSRTLQAMAAWQRPATVTVTSVTPARSLTAVAVTAGFFSLLGVAPELGRTFQAEEATPGHRVAVVSHALWRGMLAAGPGVIGSKLRLGEAEFDIVGVMPRDFRDPSGGADLWLPLAMSPGANDRGQHYLQAIARLQRNATIDQAQAEMNGIAASLAAEHPATNKVAVRLVPLAEQVAGPTRPLLLIALGGVAIVLLIACANVAALQLIKAPDREREMAIRAALGATRADIFHQMLAESLLLGLGGAAGALGVAAWALDLTVALAGQVLPRAEEIRLDLAAVVLMLALSIACGVLVGLAPAFQFGAAAPGAVLQAGGLHTGAVRQRRWRDGFAIAQVATALVLLAGAGLLLRSQARLQRVDPGFDAAGVLVSRLTLGARYSDPLRRVTYFRELEDGLRNLPGVRAAGAATVLPMNPFGIDFDVPYHREEAPEPTRAEAPKARFRSATPGYLAAMGIPILAGRGIEERDRADSPRVVIINQTLARRIWPGQDAVGKRLRFFWANWQTYEVAGVVADTRSYGLAREPAPELFVPYAQNPYLVMNLVVRAKSGAGPIAAAVRAQILKVDAGQPAHHETTLADLLAAATAREELAAKLLSVLAALALLLAVTGVYGVVAYSVGRRTREIGIRRALGAQTRDVLQLALSGGVRLILGGVALGLAAALALSRTLSSFLFEVAPADPLVLLSVSSILGAAGFCACCIPAWRASRITPRRALDLE